MVVAVRYGDRRVAVIESCVSSRTARSITTEITLTHNGEVLEGVRNEALFVEEDTEPDLSALVNDCGQIEIGRARIPADVTPLIRENVRLVFEYTRGVLMSEIERLVPGALGLLRQIKTAGDGKRSGADWYPAFAKQVTAYALENPRATAYACLWTAIRWNAQQDRPHHVAKTLKMIDRLLFGNCDPAVVLDNYEELMIP
ncbi:MAG: hypothetical protein KatS3mg082_1432 [Nitrospiraceae bacterium]|nr:MAG: hypothetical protein KatS3mg082_1432 [Nitrospiraceae bacterium]